MTSVASPTRRRPRDGFALVAVLYFLIVTALTIAALFFVRRSLSQGSSSMTLGARLLGAAEGAAYDELARWDGDTRERQLVGVATHGSHASRAIVVDVYVTRLATRTFSIIADAQMAGVSRRVELLVRVPLPAPHAALYSAANVSIANGVRFTADTGICGDSATAISLSPTATITIDSSIPLADRPSVSTDPIAADSTTYLRLGEAWWSELTQGADVQLAPNAHLSMSPGPGQVIFAPGDLTIDGGVGQGVLLVAGHLVIAGPFTFSGQIVARHGIETRADNITISGSVGVWRASVDTTASDARTDEIMLTGTTTLRYSRCDARHGIASWLQPRRVRGRAFAELF